MDEDLQPEEPQGRGRPTAFKPEFVEQAKKLCELGATDDEMADFFGVHRATFYRWKMEHEDFCDAIKVGKEMADERVERSLYQKATGYNYTEQQAIKVKVGPHEERIEIVEVRRHAPAETTAGIFWSKNRRPDRWRDKVQTEITGKDGEAIKIEQVAHDADAFTRAIAGIASRGGEASAA